MNDSVEVDHATSSASKKVCEKRCEKCQKKEHDKQSMDLKNSFIVSALILFSTIHALAQTPVETKTFLDDPFSSPMLPLYLAMGFMVVTFLLVVVVALYTLKIIKIFVGIAEKEKATRLGIAYKPSVSWWERIWSQANALRPIEEEKSIEMDHDFDGIKELDNHLPPWWTSLFVATVIWGVIYFFVFHVSQSLPLSEGEYENEVALAEEQARIYRASQPASVIDENTLVFTNDAGIIAKGKAVFESNCIACHRNDGGGNTIGPNLTDRFWLHGGQVKNVFTTIKNGVVEKGMPAWGKSLSPQDVRDVTFFVLSLQGSDPKDAKAPQGEEMRIQDAIPLDTTPVDSIRSKEIVKL